MSALHHHLRLLDRVLLALQASLLAAQAAVVEVDLIFPRNDTYAPGPFMPVVFAIQNSAIAAPLDMIITWNIYQLPGNNGFSGVIDIGKTNFTGTDPFFAADYAQRLNGTEAGWSILWSLSFANCSENFQGGATVTKTSETRHLLFSTKPGAPAPNLVQSPSACVNSTGVAIDTAGTLPIDKWDNNDHDSCLVLASPPIVASNSCAVIVDEATASSILGKRCGPDYSTTCPSDSGASAQGTSVLVSWLLPVLAGLVL